MCGVIKLDLASRKWPIIGGKLTRSVEWNHAYINLAESREIGQFARSISITVVRWHSQPNVRINIVSDDSIL